MNLLSAEVTISPALAYYPPGASYGPRTLTDFELVWLRGGERAVARRRRMRTPLRLAPGDLLLIPPGTRDEFRWDREVPTRHGYVHFRLRPRSGQRAGAAPRPGCTARPAGAEFLLWLGEAQGPGWRERAGELLAADHPGRSRQGRCPSRRRPSRRLSPRHWITSAASGPRQCAR